MWKSVRASFIYRKNGEKWKKELEKEEKQENGKSRKADKNKEISYMWKNGKKSRKCEKSIIQSTRTKIFSLSAFFNA